MSPAPGTWHDSNPGELANFQTAKAAWVDAAAPVLEGIAAAFGGSITYSELRERLFEATGFRTRSLVSNWIGEVLGAVQDATLTDGRPPLSSLVVRAETGGVGEGYINHDHPRGFSNDEERQRAAAEDRLACYRRFCEGVPADAKPQMTQLWRAKKAAKVQPDPAPVPICPECFMALPASGRCDCG